MVNLPKPNLNASSQVQIVSCAETEDTPSLATCVEDGKFTKEREQWRRQQMKSLCNVNHNLTPEESSQLLELLANHHDVFSLEEGERGETSLVEFSIDTGDSTPKKQAVCRIPYASRQEIANQLRKMQLEGVIQPSESPWASSVVLVRK